MEGTTSTVFTILDSIGSVFEAAIGWAGTVGTEIVDTPILMVFVAVPLVGLGVGLFKRLINVN